MDNDMWYLWRRIVTPDKMKKVRYHLNKAFNLFGYGDTEYWVNLAKTDIADAGKHLLEHEKKVVKKNRTLASQIEAVKCYCRKKQAEGDST